MRSTSLKLFFSLLYGNITIYKYFTKLFDDYCLLFFFHKAEAPKIQEKNCQSCSLRTVPSIQLSLIKTIIISNSLCRNLGTWVVYYQLATVNEMTKYLSGFKHGFVTSVTGISQQNMFNCRGQCCLMCHTAIPWFTTNTVYLITFD